MGLGAESETPVGMQLIGKPFAEAQLLALGHSMEQALPTIGSPITPL